MSAAAGRKKSIIGSASANNTVLNKAASSSTSLYQQCSVLRSRLMRVQDFAPFFSLALPSDASSSRRSTDVVTQVWDCFALGVPLCYLYNLIPDVQPLDVDVDISSFDPSNEKARKRAIAMFAMGLRSLEGCGTFMVTDLWDRETNDGFVRVRVSHSSFTRVASSSSVHRPGRQPRDHRRRSSPRGGVYRGRASITIHVFAQGLKRLASRIGGCTARVPWLQSCYRTRTDGAKICAGPRDHAGALRPLITPSGCHR